MPAIQISTNALKDHMTVMQMPTVQTQVAHFNASVKRPSVTLGQAGMESVSVKVRL